MSGREAKHGYAPLFDMSISRQFKLCDNVNLLNKSIIRLVYANVIIKPKTIRELKIKSIFGRKNLLFHKLLYLCSCIDFQFYPAALFLEVLSYLPPH